ncbi:hypothetical protein KDA_41540 [Dictyobacter alpinus]|uniref:Uncharacterized protein n=1 Tax=Dictyobacter alpinus TaxID=2014873 RepID=A0A402BBK4_9CHLR|nr:hypothetical protein KDA_41540 [Dictyobacter alpinus]
MKVVGEIAMDCYRNSYLAEEEAEHSPHPTAAHTRDPTAAVAAVDHNMFLLLPAASVGLDSYSLILAQEAEDSFHPRHPAAMDRDTLLQVVLVEADNWLPIAEMAT